MRNCSMVYNLWARLGFRGDNFFTTPDITSWLMSNVRGQHGSLFLSSLWWIWKWRNNDLFEQVHWEEDYLIWRILIMQFSLKISLMLTWMIGLSYLPVGGIHLLWAITSLMLTGASYSLQGNCGRGNSHAAELSALKIGLVLAWEKGVRYLLVKSDDLELVQVVNVFIPGDSSHFGEPLLEIISMLKREWDVQVHHILREANFVADSLAKIGR
ncbi:Ribonuclease H domain [Sesbania bispinosa]|nr:Ribonuclease H domain [Sesbania bispinosa]